MRKKSKKKLEWSKLFATSVAIIFAIYGIWCGIEYYILCKLAIESSFEMPDSTLAVTCVTTVLASLLTYCLYQGALKLSLNKNKLTIDTAKNITRSIVENEFLDAIDIDCESEEQEE